MPNTSSSRIEANMRRRKLPSLDLLSAKGNDLAFNEALHRYDKLLHYGASRFGSKEHAYKDNLHHARLALWKTLLWKSTQSHVGHSKFLGKFQREMKLATANDSIGRIQRVGLRLDNPRRGWHERIPDEQTSVNMHLVKKPVGLRRHFVSERGKELLEKARRERRRDRRREKREKLRQLAEIAFEKRLTENTAKARTRERFQIGLMNKIALASVKTPFLFIPSQVVRVLGHRSGKKGEAVYMVQSRPFEVTQIRKLMGRVAPENPKELKYYQPVKLKPEEKERIVGVINELNRYWPIPFFYVKEYYDALGEYVKRKGTIPKEIKKDLEKTFEKAQKRWGPSQSEEIDDYEEF